MSKLTKALTAAAGNAGGDNLYVEDVFSTYLYTGNDSTQTITNGIDLDGEGGMLWLKPRNQAQNHIIFDTARGITKSLTTNNSNAEYTATAGNEGLQSFNNDGFTTKLYQNSTGINNSACNVASWTFRKAEKFFDVVTWTGDGSTTTHNHNLGSTPAVIMVKRVDSTSNWSTYHKDATDTVRSGEDLILYLNTTAAATYLGATLWSATDSTFTTSGGGNFNASGGTYVAYLFASDAGGFGDDGSESIIKCGSFTTDGSGNATVDLGFEPQFVIYKSSSGSSSWLIYDVMRGWTAGDGPKNLLRADSSTTETVLSSNNNIQLTSTGFYIDQNANETQIYIAIRRPMKTPESGTEVFSPYAYQDATLTSGSGTASNRTILNGGVNGGTNFPVDMWWHARRSPTNVYGWTWFDRLRGKGKSIITTNNNSEPAGDGATNSGFDFQEGVDVEYNGENYYYTTAAGNRTHIAYFFKRASGFFDESCYVGVGTAQHIYHNLGVVPEFIIVKARDYDSNGHMMHIDANANGMRLQGTPVGSVYYMLNGSTWSDVVTDTRITFANNNNVTRSGYNFVCWMFASVDGVSKCGSYTGTGSNIDVDCGFANGARMVLIRRTDASAVTYLWDSERGIVSGNDPYLTFTNDIEVTSTDYIDPLSSGFTVTSSAPAALNASGGNYIFLAIAQELLWNIVFNQRAS